MNGDYRQSWERVPEGPKPEGPPIPHADHWREYVEPCPDNGREHDCTFDYIMRWEVGQFLAWAERVRADAWDEGNRTRAEYERAIVAAYLDDGVDYIDAPVNPYHAKGTA